MMRLLLAGFLIAHGLIHAAIYEIPKDPKKPAPFDPNHSWALEGVHVAEHAAHRLGKAMAGLTEVLLAVAGMALLGNSSLLMPARSLGASPGCS